ncbi:FAD-binding protein [Sphingomonas sp. RHCKR7]|uniref:FAD-binding oxidoreductase n=1 Tax=Sphingomonas folli TaxID=2862497 RepID=UPI001CA58A11|nr:FAD-linked oxidase C-terminal domain-containing protein [Sphingomonas folli]MBW6528547.1 FAD-binding protein [Sphingomonas folli]
MNAILDVSPDDFTATVEPGVTKEALNAALRPHGLFFSVDPGAHATIGGMAATRASGTNTVRYGSMRENVLACTTVLADGRVVCAGSRTMKSAAGLDLARLFVGSEGTLGIITELTVKLHPLPEAVSAAIVSFPDAAGAVTTVIQGVQVGLPLARAEYLCPNTIRVVNATNPGLSLQERHTLFLEFHGSSQVGLDEQAGLMGRIAAENGGGDFAWASHPEDRTRLWHARHNAYFSCQRSRPGSIILTTDTCVPRSRLAESLAGAMRIMADAVFPHMIFGHVGDGNFHVLMAIDPSSESEHSEAETLNTAIVDLALSLGGTCSGEHGIGFHKKAFLRREAGEDATEVMRQIKSLLDPRNIMNPDKIF